MSYTYTIENGEATIVGKDYLKKISVEPITGKPFTDDQALEVYVNEFITKLPFFISYYEFRSRFTFEAKKRIENSDDLGVKVLEKDLEAARETGIDLNNIDLINGMAYYVYAGLLSEEEMHIILKK